MKKESTSPEALKTVAGIIGGIGIIALVACGMAKGTSLLDRDSPPSHDTPKPPAATATLASKHVAPNKSSHAAPKPSPKAASTAGTIATGTLAERVYRFADELRDGDEAAQISFKGMTVVLLSNDTARMREKKLVAKADEYLTASAAVAACEGWTGPGVAASDPARSETIAKALHGLQTNTPMYNGAGMTYPEGEAALAAGLCGTVIDNYTNSHHSAELPFAGK